MKPNDTTQLVDLLQSEYGLSCSLIEIPEDGLSDNTYIVTCEKRKYVVKTYDKGEQARALAQYQNTLYAAGVPVPAIVPTRSEDLAAVLEERHIVLCEFARGQPIGWHEDFAQIPSRLSTDLAKAMARMHCATQEMAIRPKLNHALSVSNVHKDYKRDIPGMSHGEHFAQVRRVMIHGDMTRENILVSTPPHKLEAIIDFGDAHYDYITYDIAIALTQIYVTKSWGIDFEGMEDFLGAYFQCNALTTIERQTILPLMILRNVILLQDIELQLIHSGGDGKTLESIKQSLLVKLRLLREHSQKLERLFVPTDKYLT